MGDDEKFMRLALDAARNGVGRVSPNPAVGAVIVRDGTVLATGWHRAAGLPHAEIEALQALPDPAAARGSTLYVTLEPCSTLGRTPPCTEAIRTAGCVRVVVGATDPNPAHAGRAFPLLREAGIAVTHGVLEPACRELNCAFNKWIVNGLPWVIAKAGMTLDGRIARAPDQGRWITSQASRQHAQRHLRARADAILVGAGTLRADNPRLTVRGMPGARQPWRVVVTKSGNLPPDAHLFTDTHRERTLVFRDQPLGGVLGALGAREIQTVLIEGGGQILGEAFDAGLVDEVAFYLAPLLCGGPFPAIAGKGAPAPGGAPRLVGTRYERIGEDLFISGKIA